MHLLLRGFRALSFQQIARADAQDDTQAPAVTAALAATLTGLIAASCGVGFGPPLMPHGTP
jgi:uncharacterized membrane protein YfcA